MDVKSRDHEFAIGLLIKSFNMCLSNIKIKVSNFLLRLMFLKKLHENKFFAYIHIYSARLGIYTDFMLQSSEHSWVLQHISLILAYQMYHAQLSACVYIVISMWDFVFNDFIFV